jgi:hypothetical protein
MNPGGTAKSARDMRPESCAESSAFCTKGSLLLPEGTFHSTKSASVQVQQSLQVLSCESQVSKFNSRWPLRREQQHGLLPHSNPQPESSAGSGSQLFGPYRHCCQLTIGRSRDRPQKMDI